MSNGMMRTVTREDTAEIDCHGVLCDEAHFGRQLSNMEHVLQSREEFTKRAYFERTG